MKYRYRTQGTCSQAIEFDVNDGVVSNVMFYGGCDGNLKGIAQLVKGLPFAVFTTLLADCFLVLLHGLSVGEVSLFLQCKKCA